MNTFQSQNDVSSEDFFSKAFSISISGRIIEDEILKISAANKKRYVKSRIEPGLLALFKVELVTLYEAFLVSKRVVFRFRFRLHNGRNTQRRTTL